MFRRASAFRPPRSLYFHVPFCRIKCGYCDFFSLPIGKTSDSELAGFVAAGLDRVRRLSGRFHAGRFDTLYVGGGTPSVLPAPFFELLLEGLAEIAPAPLEWTVEANPESLDAQFLSICRAAGVTRLSIGIQSLDDEVLAVLGRLGRSESSYRALELAAGADFAVSADLIAGPPRRNGIAAEAERLLDFGIGHLSVYDLTLEEGTALAATFRRGELELLDEDEAAAEREELESLLRERGFLRYEVSNYARPGAESLHNLAYWNMDSYLGVGPSAVSTLVEEASPYPEASGRGGGALRVTESRSLETYRQGRAGEAALEERIDPKTAAFEVLMMGMRTRYGVDLGTFHERFGLRLEEMVSTSLGRWNEYLVPGVPPPGEEERGSSGTGRRERIALNDTGLNLLNRFLADCLEEFEDHFPADGDSGGAISARNDQ